MIGKSGHILFEVLEPRIMLSADGLLNAIVPDQDQDALLDGMEEVAQYAELLDTNEQVEEQISLESAPPYTTNNDVCQPIITLLVDDDNTNDESVDADLSVGNIVSVQVNSEIAVLSNDSEGDIESKVDTPEDEGPQVYLNDAKISIEENTSIEIRGPPASETVNSEIITSSSINNEESEADHTILDQYAAKLQPDGTVNLPGLVLVDPGLTNLEGQVVYLHFDGEKSIDYSGPVLVEGINVPEFALPGSLAGQEEVVITHIVEELERIFAGSGVIFTIETPNSTQPYSTVYIGGDYSAFAEYGSFLGLAEQVDIGNQNLCDNAFVFSETFVNEYKNANTLETHLADVIAHEVGHLLGYAHEHQAAEGSILSAVAWTQLTGDPGLWPYADGPTQEVVTLPHNTLIMGTAVGTYDGQTAIFSVGGWNPRTYSRDAPGTDPRYWDNRQSHFSIYMPATDSWISADGTDDIDNEDGTWTSVGLTGYNNGNGTNSPLESQGTSDIMDQCFYYDGAVYAFGGYPQWGGQMAKYDIATNSWSQVALGDNEGLCDNGGGGRIGSHWYKVHREGYLMDYDAITDTFGPDIAIPGLKNPQHGAGAGVIGNKLYIVDTYNAATPGVVYEIDPMARTVVEKSPAPIPVGYAGTVVYNGRLYLLGGFTAEADIIQIYDPMLDKWWVSPDKLPDSRWGLLAEVVSSTLYVGNGTVSWEVVANDLWSSGMPTIPGVEGYGDLVVTAIDVPGTAVAGQPLRIEWDVLNSDPNHSAGAGFIDAVYLSSDVQWDYGDIRLATVQREEPVGPQQSYHVEKDVILPGILPGACYLIVRADALNQIEEPDDQNNIGVSDPIQVDIEELLLDTQIEGEFTVFEQSRYYKVTVDEGKDLEIEVDDLDNAGANELYVSLGTVPTRSQFDYRYPTNFAADQTIRIPGTRAGTYYILAYASYLSTTDPAVYAIGVNYLPFQITKVTPDRSGNTELSTPSLTIEGSGFQPNCEVVLRRQGDADIAPTSLDWHSTGTIFARFDLRGAPAGDWNLTVINPDSQSVSFPFSIIEGGVGELETSLILPEALGYHIRSTLWILYANVGVGPMPAPLLKLHGGQDALLTVEESMDGPGLWTSDPPKGLSDTVQVLASGPDADPAILNPGESGRIPVYFRGCKEPWDWSYPPIEFELGVLTHEDTTPIDFEQVEADVRPDPEDISPELWSVIWPQVQEQMGPTWGGYLQKLQENSGYLAAYGKDTYSVRDLFAMEIAKATNAFVPPRTLAASVDAYCPAPGLSLVFGRVATDSIVHRFELGPLGRGWSHSFEYSLKRPDGIAAIVEGPGGTARTFTRVYPNIEAPWRAALGDYGILREKSDGTFTLWEKDGLTWTFDLAGHLVSLEEPNGNRITLSYLGDNLTHISHSNGLAFGVEYNSDERIAALADHAGRQTRYIYDETGKYLIRVIAPGDRVTEYEYNMTAGGPASHALRSVTFPDGTHTYYNYDDRGRLKEQYRDGGAERIVFDYEDFNQVMLRDAIDSGTTVNYGLPGQMAEVVNPLGNVASFDYSTKGVLTGIVAPDGSPYETDYDERGNLIELEDPLGYIISMGYAGPYNRLSYSTDQNGNRTDFATDIYGNLTSTTYPDSTVEQYEYDEAGNVTSYTNRRGQTINYTYDVYGRLIEKQYPNGRSVTYAYDSVGRLTEATDDSGTISLEYDDRGFLIRIEYPDSHWFTFSYNDAGQRTQRVGDDGYTLNYYYDEAGQLERLTDADWTDIVVYTYDDVGRLIREDKGNGTYTTYEYDSAGQVLSLVNYSPTDDVQSRFDYTYDENGKRTSMKTLEGTTHYEYDATGQLIGVTYPDGRQVTYEYDPAGNRIAVTDDGATTAYTTNNMNQYAEVGNATYTYDVNGNMTSKTDGTGTTTYEYDEESRVIRVTNPDGTWEYTYNALGNRVAVSHNGSVTHYVHDPIGLTDVAAEYTVADTLTARYIHGIGLAASIDSGGHSVYYAFDAIGSTIALTNTTGAVLNQYAYDPFGVLLTSVETTPNTFKYVGKYGVADEPSGIICMRQRFYSASIGRFLQQDPRGLQGGDTNLYRYVENQPTMKCDPRGEGEITPGVLFLRVPISWRTNPFRVHVGPGLGVSTPGGYIFFKEGIIYGGAISGTVLSISLDVRDQEQGLYAEGVAIYGTGLVLDKREGERIQTSFAFGYMFGLQVLYRGMGEAKLQNLPYYPWSYLVPKAASGILQKLWSAIAGSYDPNSKIGPHGFSSERYITPDRSMVYTIHFENESDATAAAKQVRIVDELDPDLDWTTFELLEIGFGPHQITVPSGMTHYQERLEIDGWTYSQQEGWHTGETPLILDVDTDIDITTGQITWIIISTDPETGWEPQDPYAGFLPPDDPEDVNHRGEGYVTFLIRPKADLPTGTQITNTASIYFDANPAIDTPEVLNTIDAGAPASAVLPLADRQTTTNFVVSWTGSDDTGGSGIAEYEIYVSDNDGPYTLWTTTSESSSTFTGDDQHQYAFYSIAHDNVGHVEAPPELPDTTTKVILNQPPMVDIGPDTTVNEGEVLLRTCSFIDPDPADSWTATVDYGDGTGEQALPLDGQTFELNHVYADDGDYTVVVTVTDSYEESNSDEFIVAVLNVAPTVEAGPDQIINEGQVVALAPATFNDLGTLDTHTATVDWGDGTAPEPVVLTESPFGPPGSTSGADGTVAGSHVYADDGTHMVTVIVTDDDGGSGSASFTVTVDNVAPEISEFSSDATLSNKGSENEDVVVFASFVDVGKLDTHTAEIHWGDGVVTQGTVTESAGVGTVSASHAYAFGGIYTITLILEDDDSGVAQVTTTAVITGIGVQNGQLQIIGTDAKDKVSINLVGGKHHGDNHKGKLKNQYIRVHANFLPKAHSGDDDDEDDNGGSRFRDFDADAVSSILMVLCDGDDHAKIAGNIAIDAIIDGGHGRDKLKGGAGNDIVLGGAGNDKIQGRSGADILIGGLGRDRLVGNKGDDILIGDTTVYDSDQAEDKFADVEALLAILDEWTSDKSYAERRDNISGENPSDDRLNDGFFLAPGVTVWDDGERDKLTGSSGEDWFILSGKDKGTDLHKHHDDNDKSCHHFI